MGRNFRTKKQENIKDVKNAFIPIMGSVCVVFILIALANLSTALMLFGVSILLLIIGRISIKQILTVCAGGLVLLLFVVFLGPRRETYKSRINSFLHPELQHSDKTYQSDHAKIALATGGFLGKGPGNSTERNFLPHPYSDFIFAIIVEEYGLVGAVGIIFLYLLLFVRFIIDAQKATTLFGKLLIIGLGFPIIFQAFINMGVAVELLPVTGQPLPLISSGGTSIWMTCIAIGIILSVTKKEEEVALDLEEKRKRDEALQQIIDAQVALNEDKEADENQQKINDIKSSIRESLIEDENGDVLVNGQNPMNAVLNKR